MSDYVAAVIGTTLGESIFLTIFGMAFVSLRRKPNEPPIPSFSNGGLPLFLKTWGLTFVCSLIVEIAVVIFSISESNASIPRLFIPSIFAFYYTRRQLAVRKV